MARSQYLPLHRVSNDRRGGSRGSPSNGRIMDGTAGDSPFRSPVTALDGPDKVTGAARYTFDVTLPGMVHAKVLRSPHPHARIVAIDASRAEALPGVVAVVTGADAIKLPDPYYGVAIRDQPVLGIDKVRYVGDMVAAVAALDEETAYRALALIDVRYDPLLPVTTIDEALAEDAPLLFDAPVAGEPIKLGDGVTSLKEPRPNVLCEFAYTNGDADTVLARSDHVFEDRFRFSRINHFHLEPHVNVARVTGAQIELWSCNQDPFVLRGDIARIFGRPANNIRIHASYVGGGFGGKSFCKMEPLVVLLAMKAGRPVRLCLSLDESLLTLTKHAGILMLKTGVTKDGRLTARKSEIQLDGGAYSDASALTVVKTGYRITGPYRWDAVATRACAVRTNTVPAGSFRGFGGTQASFASESQIDMIARRLGIDPYDFRRKNLLAVGEPFQPGDSGIDSDLWERSRRGRRAPRLPAACSRPGAGSHGARHGPQRRDKGWRRHRQPCPGARQTVALRTSDRQCRRRRDRPGGNDDLEPHCRRDFTAPARLGALRRDRHRPHPPRQRHACQLRHRGHRHRRHAGCNRRPRPALPIRCRAARLQGRRTPAR